MTRPVLATADPIVIDHVRSLAAAGNTEVELVNSLLTLGSCWSGDRLLLLGSDFIEAAQALGKRRNMAVVTWQFDTQAAIPADLWQRALIIGAEHVVALPQADDWLAERLTPAAVVPGKSARVLAIGGVCGGAGASTCAVGISVAAQQAGHGVLLVDADLSGGGLDLLLGAEAQPGVRWPELALTSGRMSAETLIPALPTPHGISLISASRDSQASPTSAAWLSILECAAHTFDVVVIDLGRNELPQDVRTFLNQLNTPVWWMVPTRIRAVAAASAVLERASTSWGNQEIIVRKVDRSMNVNDVGRALGKSVYASIAEDAKVMTAAEQGLLAKGTFAKTCDQLFRGWWAT